MTKLEIYNIALSQHGKKCTQEEIDATIQPTEVEACVRMFETAVQDVLGEQDWSFCVVPIELDREDDEPYGKWHHGYAMPNDIIRIARSDMSMHPFKVSGGRFYTDEDNPEVWGISYTASILEMAPRDFCNLVGLWLGYLISTIISPSDNNLAQRILQNYSAHLQALNRREQNNRHANYLDEDDWSRQQ